MAKRVRDHRKRKSKKRMSFSDKVRKVMQRRLDKKYVDVVISGASNLYAGALSLFPATALTEGTGDNDRIGDSIQPIRLKLKYRASLAPIGTNSVATLGTALYSRCIVGIDRIADGNLVTAQDLFESNATVFTDYNQVNMLNKTKRFEILHDKIFTHVTGCSNTAIVEELSFDLSKHPKCKYLANTGAVGSIGTYHPFIFFTSSSTSNQVGIDGYVRLEFEDA